MRNKLIFSLTTFLVFIVFASSCFKEEVIVTPAQIDFAELPYKTLSEYGFFVGELNELVPGEKVLLYEPSSTLFTDYAHKSRFVWMPEGTSAIITEDIQGRLEFPNNAILIKNFYYPKDINNPEGEKEIVETRLLIKQDEVWQAYPYLWNEEQTEANYKITGANIPKTVTDDDGVAHDIVYVMPNKNQCKSCHNINEALKPIGPKAKSMNFALDYGNGVPVNQLAKWKEVGYLSNFTSSENYASMVDYNDVHADLDLRAKAYLDANCAHCHNAESPASTSGLFMTYEEESMDKWGVFKTPVAAGKGAGSFTFDIDPGHAESSIMIYRMNSTEPGIMMAELGRSMVHKEGVELISEWINAMSAE